MILHSYTHHQFHNLKDLWGYESESESEVAQSCPTLCNPWTVAYQAPPSMGFSRQEYWSGLPLRPINNKRLLLSKENQISRRKEFSNLLCMGL